MYPYLTIVSPSHWQITIPFVRRSTWSHIWLRDQHLFNHLHIRDRVRIQLSVAQATCVLRSLKLLVRWISRFTLRRIRRWSLWVSMSQWLGIYEGVWAPFSRVWMTMRQSSRIRSPQTSLHLGQSSSFSRPSIGRPEAPLVQEGHLKTCPRSPHHTAHGGEERLLKVLTIVYPTNKPAVELVTPLPSSTPLDRTYTYQPVKYPADISQLHSRKFDTVDS